MNGLKEFLQWLFESVRILVIVQPFETGIRIRRGNKIKKLEKGIYFRLPYFDSVYIQESRLRIASIPIQTITSKDLKTITLNASFGYSIGCIETLYDTLFHPETSIQNIAMAEITSFVYKKDLAEIKIEDLEKEVLNKLRGLEYGLEFKYFKVTNFAVVRTFRLIKDESWIDEGLRMNEKN